MRYAIMIGDFDGFSKVMNFVQPFGGTLVTDVETIGSDSVETFFGDQEVLTIMCEIPEENVAYFEAFSKKVGLLDGEQMKRVEETVAEVA